MLLKSPENPSFGAEVDGILKTELDSHRDVFEATAAMLERPFAHVLDILVEGLGCGGKVLFFGNGGSAADAQHLATELIIRYQKNRPPIAAIALSADSSVITACGNDWGFDTIFERQIAGLGRECDVAFGISTSGRSANVIKGLLQAKAMGLQTVGMTGGGGGEMPGCCDALIMVPSMVTARIQEMHIMIGHLLCKALEHRLGLV
jgi:D-sedoheptulose 7-phosphate isomerase